MNLLKKLCKHLTKNKYPSNLFINGRAKLPTSSFNSTDKLYASYGKDDLDERDNVKLESVRFPDFSCNWDRFSIPSDLKFRKNARPLDGCYSFTVEVARYQKIATAVHDPIEDQAYPNYAHVEVRQLLQSEDIYFEPLKGRDKKSTWARRARMEYRQNLVNSLRIEIEAK